MISFISSKINIGLNVTSRRPDGYHNLETVMVPIDWGDILEIVPAHGSDSTLTVLGRHIDCPSEKNLVMKAYRALQQEMKLPPVDIYLEKIVPDGAGLGGGSADAAFTLTALNSLFSLGLSCEHLARIAASVGADCPLFIYNKPMLATGTGTTLTPYPIDLSPYHIVVVKPPVAVSTRDAYAGIHPSPWQHPLVSVKPCNLIASRPANDFETGIFALHPSLRAIKEEIYDLGAVYASMSGSGSAIYGLFDSEQLAQQAKAHLDERGIVRICHAI
ncbi:MAG: 4-(cytidine 5'-diphospho)-2-C-methyl-D-erythritol kinase [Clostridiales bacterium]|nr:4-(cytidine 5'-diphospho)-2-C-methyl-D-erythritol kinase [Clostridiales bacterium]